MSKREIYILSSDGITLKKKSFFRTKLTLINFIFSLVIIFTILFINNKVKFVDTSFIGVISYETENQLLKSELKITNDKIQNLSNQIENLSSSDNQMRVMVNLPKIENKDLGIGGKIETKSDVLLSKDASELLSNSRILIEKLENKVSFQKLSYKDILNKYEENKIYFSSIPAIRPMTGNYAIHGGYGIRQHPILGVKRMHEGIDIMNDIGTPVFATGNGTVIDAGSTGNGYGIAIEVNHGFGYVSFYAHLSKILVSRGEKIKRGDLIGYSGNSGLSSGPHLHYEVRKNNNHINPKTYFIDGVSSFVSSR